MHKAQVYIYADPEEIQEYQRTKTYLLPLTGAYMDGLQLTNAARQGYLWDIVFCGFAEPHYSF
eukprot:scaffold163840_cov41-Prasinocladus_malaysianus.AAC.1